jgi:hypothetical protein
MPCESILGNGYSVKLFHCLELLWFPGHFNLEGLLHCPCCDFHKDSSHHRFEGRVIIDFVYFGVQKTLKKVDDMFLAPWVRGEFIKRPQSYPFFPRVISELLPSLQILHAQLSYWELSHQFPLHYCLYRHA